MYGNNYPNDYDGRNAADNTMREANAENGRFSGPAMQEIQGKPERREPVIIITAVTEALIKLAPS